MEKKGQPGRKLFAEWKKLNEKLASVVNIAEEFISSRAEVSVCLLISFHDWVLFKSFWAENMLFWAIRGGAWSSPKLFGSNYWLNRVKNAQFTTFTRLELWHCEVEVMSQFYHRIVTLHNPRQTLMWRFQSNPRTSSLGKQKTFFPPSTPSQISFLDASALFRSLSRPFALTLNDYSHYGLPR